ncbi:hypothetical protein ILUMI_06951, partial [Ignelater luminosus]
VFRLTTIVLIYYSDFLPMHQSTVRIQLKSMTPLLGYFIASAVVLLIAMKGIVQDRSILIYPYIVVMSCEVTAGIIMYLILAIVVSAIYFIMVPFTG